MTKIDIVIPVYNAEQHVEHLLSELDMWHQQSQLIGRVIFVVDGSPDKSLKVLKQQLNTVAFPFLVIELVKNRGQHTATAVGFRYVESPYVVTMDDDLQHDPEDIQRLLEQAEKENLDLVFGKFEDKKHGKIRNFGTKALQFLLKSTGNDYSVVTSFRLIRKEVLEPFKALQSKVYFIDDYLISYAANIGTATVSHKERLNGNSNYSAFRLMKMALLILLMHSSFPLKLISRLGLFVALICFGIACYFIYQKIYFNVALGYTSIIVSIFFSTGILLFTLGIIGEYIRKIWLMNKGMENVYIREIHEG